MDTVKAGLPELLPVPLIFIQDHGGLQRTLLGSWCLGLRHGLYCVDCCWALMALLFVGGVMNVLWISLLTMFVLQEKLIPGGRMLTRVVGAGLLIWGMPLASAALAG
ncbi:DUF2182 domain-containing protein [Bradyrhizobium icense]|uniref:DUF2182 domain-containing protein n=1 Tax=Bradyrhizobium icense TaxID=1274631 RepID=UPI0030010889